MQKKTLWKDIRRSINQSKGRFFSIMGLMMIGSFALVGLKVTGPDMRQTGENYFAELNVADMTVIGSLGLDEDDIEQIDRTPGLEAVEYGYLKDAIIKDTHDSIRIFSKTDDISQYELREGQLPEKAGEIALDNSHNKQYKIGDTITFDEKPDVSGNYVLTESTFEIVGFVYSGEILSNVNQGPSMAGTGSLEGYAVVTPDSFDSEFYMLARLTFEDLAGIDPYSDDYNERLQAHKDDMDDLLKDQPEKRLATIKKEAQDMIDDGQKKIDDAVAELEDKEAQLAEAEEALADGQAKIDAGEEELIAKISEAEAQIARGEEQIRAAKNALAAGTEELTVAARQLADGEATLDAKWDELQTGKQALDQARNELTAGQQKLDGAAAELQTGRQQLTEGYRQLEKKQDELAAAAHQLQAGSDQLARSQAKYDAKEKEFIEAAAELEAARQELVDKNRQLTDKQNELDEQAEALEQADREFKEGIQTLKQTQTDITRALEQAELAPEQQAILTKQLEEVTAQLAQVTSQYEAFRSETYTPGRQKIEAGQEELDKKALELEKATLAFEAKEKELTAASKELAASDAELKQASKTLDAKKEELAAGQAQIKAGQAELQAKEQLLAEKEAEYTAGRQELVEKTALYNTKLQTYYDGLEAWTDGMSTLDKKSAEYQAGRARLEQAQAELAAKEGELAVGKDQLAAERRAGEEKLAAAKAELAAKQEEFDEKSAEFLDIKPSAEQEIADKQKELDEAQETLDHLSLPVYTLNSRREIPGAEGYKIYSSISDIVDSLADIFPIFLYFVAGLVTLTTMGRMVDEERTKSGVLKALGYGDRDIRKKFVFYGLTSALSGTVIGIALGHTLLPYIVYNAYSTGFTVPRIEWHFHWGISVAAVALALISSAVPAYIASSKALKERPAQLLLPKPPADGSKILLERITPLWDRLSFTYKVTARNIFRYKQRMLMTIFGVAGAVALLFTGLSVQHSIQGINNRQFDDLMQYDLIVAQNDYVSDGQAQEINDALNSDDIKQYQDIHFEELSTNAGPHNDAQDIKLIVPESNDQLKDYVQLVHRQDGQSLELSSEGVVLSERLATLLDVEPGDEITLEDSEVKEHTFTVDATTEMYMGHFMFASAEAFEKSFGTSYETNAYLVNLSDNSDEQTQVSASEFIELAGIAGVVQNTTLTKQVDTIVTSLNKVMSVLIIVAALLGVVILYNLTNINVSERMRELSTIKVLGFFNREVTLYIYRETIALTFIGILVGYVMGMGLHQYILMMVSPDDVMFNPALSASSFIIPAAIITIVTAALAAVINHRLKNVDMLEALQAAD